MPVVNYVWDYMHSSSPIDLPYLQILGALGNYFTDKTYILCGEY